MACLVSVLPVLTSLHVITAENNTVYGWDNSIKAVSSSCNLLFKISKTEE